MCRFGTRVHGLAVCALVAAMAACGEAQMRVENGVKVDAARCSAVTASQLAWLSTDWQPFAAFAKACAVKHGTAQLFLISVWVDDYEAKLAKDAPAPKYPKPVIASVDGKI